jgi:[ribosomal protein S5]-alanine N-acetyltransferase
MELLTPRIRLREYRLDDYAALRELDSDPIVQHYEHPVLNEDESLTKLKQFLENQTREPRTHYRFAITILSSDRLRGRISLTLNHPTIREYEIGWTLHYQDWGQGYATEAAHAVMNFAFNRLKAHRVVAFCHAENRASERVMQKLGMQREGLLREAIWLHDTWSNELVYAILDREFQNSQPLA